MGSDKAFLHLGCQTLLAHALALAATAAPDVRIVGDPQRFLPFGRVVQDVFPDAVLWAESTLRCAQARPI